MRPPLQNLTIKIALGLWEAEEALPSFFLSVPPSLLPFSFNRHRVNGDRPLSLRILSRAVVISPSKARRVDTAVVEIAGLHNLNNRETYS